MEAVGKEKRNGIDTTEVMNASGFYIKSLVKMSSRFDKYMRGNNTALSNREINGFKLFMGKKA